MKINHPARLEKTNPNKPNPLDPNKRLKTLVLPLEGMNQKKLNIFKKILAKAEQIIQNVLRVLVQLFRYQIYRWFYKQGKNSNHGFVDTNIIRFGRAHLCSGC